MEITKNKAKMRDAFAKGNIYDLIGPRLVAAAALAVFTGLAILLSLYDAELDFIGANWNVIIYKVGITDGLFIVAMQVGQIFCEGALKKSELSPYTLSRHAYESAYSDIRPIKDYFSQFFTWFKQSELRNKRIDWIMDQGHFDDMAKVRKLVKYCRLDEVDTLILHPIKRPIEVEMEDGTTQDSDQLILLPKMSDEQAGDIRHVLEGKIRLENVQNYQYYLSMLAKKGTKSILEEPYELDKGRKHSLTASQIMAIGAFTLLHIFLALVTINEFYGNSTSAWINLIERMLAIANGLWCGFTVKTGDLKYVSDIIFNKADVLEYYHIDSDNGSFKPLADEAAQEASWEAFIAKKKAEDEQILKDEAERKQRIAREKMESEEAKNRYEDYFDGYSVKADSLQLGPDGKPIQPASKKFETVPLDDPRVK